MQFKQCNRAIKRIAFKLAKLFIKIKLC